MPRDFRKTTQVSGIGPKMAHMTAHMCCGFLEGVPVDSHLMQMFKVLGWVPATPTNRGSNMNNFLCRSDRIVGSK